MKALQLTVLLAFAFVCTPWAVAQTLVSETIEYDADGNPTRKLLTYAQAPQSPPPTAPPPTTPTPAVPPPAGQPQAEDVETVQRRVGQAVFVVAPELPSEEIPQPDAFNWDFGNPDGKYNQLPGFNAAHVYEQPGEYLVRFNGEPFLRVEVAPETRPVIRIGSDGDVAAVGKLAVIPEHTQLLFRRGEKHAIARGMSITRDGVLIGAYGEGQKPVLVHNAMGGRVMFDVKANNFTLQDVTIDNAEAGRKARADTLSFTGVGATIRNVTVLKSHTFVNGNTNPIKVYIEGCDAPDRDGLVKYFLWGQGREFVLLNNTVSNSAGEHCVRLNGMHRVLLFDNDLTELKDYGLIKGTVTGQGGTYYWIENNRSSVGDLSVGPMADYPENAPSRTRYVVVRNNRMLAGGDLIFAHGTEYLWAGGNTVEPVGHSPGAIQAGISIQGHSRKWGRALQHAYIEVPAQTRLETWDNIPESVTIVKK
ncbi:MAG: hypothetical protein ACFCVE_15125 [Phycisphaerae bacterium]